jgi:hypothetical protein
MIGQFNRTAMDYTLEAIQGLDTPGGQSPRSNIPEFHLELSPNEQAPTPGAKLTDPAIAKRF